MKLHVKCSSEYFDEEVLVSMEVEDLFYDSVWKVISVKSLLYVINVVIKKNAVFCKRSLKYPA